ncbi:MAG TPA: LmbU family transcriptional regulator [Streptosporangiaceae bacterium]|jgi:hypothetical protein
MSPQSLLTAAAPRTASLDDSKPAGATPVILPQTGLLLDRQMPYERWIDIGRQLASAVSSSAWCLGDWLVYGETRFTGRYRNAIERTSLEYKTLRNYAWVARKIPLDRRHECLSFGHHAEVAGLAEPEQDFWLRKAESLSWSRNELRRQVHASLAERGAEPAGPDDSWEPGDTDEPTRIGEPAHADISNNTGTGESGSTGESGGTGEQPDYADFTADLTSSGSDCRALQVEVTEDQLEMIRQAASKAQLTVARWAPPILEEAARSLLDAELGEVRDDESAAGRAGSPSDRAA